MLFGDINSLQTTKPCNFYIKGQYNSESNEQHSFLDQVVGFTELFKLR